MLMMLEESTEGQEEYGPDDLLTPEEAAAYLAKRWGRKSFSVEGLRSLRRREGLKPAKQKKRMTMWKRSQLDEIKEPERRGQHVNADSEGNVDSKDE